MKRHPDQTRERLLQAAFDEIYRNGFRSASMDEILAKAGVTKGALYHHFESKTELGYAVVDEIIEKHILGRWLSPLENVDDPVQALTDMLLGMREAVVPQAARFGCPLNNLAQEMSPIDEGFRQRIHRVFSLWRNGIATALRRGQQKGFVRPDLDPNKTSWFLISALEGAVGMAKNAQDPQVLDSWGESMIQYLQTLRVPG
jgi:AcrR family transcriptional regulator